MTFDTWISKILGSLSDEAKPGRETGRAGETTGRRIERANFNPVELREIRPDPVSYTHLTLPTSDLV